MSNVTDRLRSSVGVVSVMPASTNPTASTSTKWVLWAASLVTACNASLSITRVPRPRICSK